MESKHKLGFCNLCDREIVICGTCGNNCCNGGSGKVGTEPCPDCDEAYLHQEKHFNGVVVEFSENLVEKMRGGQ